MKIVFMGTPDFAVPSLNTLVLNGYDVKAVVTQPDKPTGRGYKLLPPAVKAAALTHNIPVYQPLSLKKGDDAEQIANILKEIEPDYIIVVAYGKILPKAVLDAPKKACINVHASLLPKYRGAGPIQWSVLNGETETGVTTMLMAEGLDTGDMLLTAKIEIGINETSSELHDRLSEIGAKTLIETIKAFEKGQIKPIAQIDLDSTYAPMITKDLCKIDFAKSANEIHNQIRGLSSSPCAKANLGGKIIKIYKSELVEGEFPNSTFGEIIDEINFIVACGDKKAIKIIELQTEGGKRLKAADFLRGNKIEIGTILY